MSLRRFLFPALLAFLMSGSTLAHDDHSAATPTAGTGTALVYLTVHNTGTEDDTLVSASTDVAERVTLHTTEDMIGMSHMAELSDGFPIAPGETLVLARGGSHLMLENLRQDLRPGDTYEVTLVFANAGEVTLTVTVGIKAPEGVDPTTVGHLEISAPWSLPAPMLAGSAGTPIASPEATPTEQHHQVRSLRRSSDTRVPQPQSGRAPRPGPTQPPATCGPDR